jgi:hypothetical protein
MDPTMPDPSSPPITTISAEEYFRQSAAIPAPYITDWRVIRVAEGIVRITLYERSYEQLAANGPIETILVARGAFTTSQAAFAVFVDFAAKTLGAWAAAPDMPKANFEPPEGRMN